jgi:hypothetical protein
MREETRKAISEAVDVINNDVVGSPRFVLGHGGVCLIDGGTGEILTTRAETTLAFLLGYLKGFEEASSILDPLG